MLNAGTKLGPYEITGVVGAGGMGEVYRARDTRLDRTVAIKVLPDRLADRGELRERFEREARTVASLNHAHICTLHDIGHQDGTDYLVMEYLEGETLAQRLQKGSLPLDQVLQYAIEIADALDKAHRKGITHRDLKPGNIMLTKSGTKLLDFGLAKLKQEVAPANVQLSQLPTANDPLTAQGTIVGTLQYMAPEQLEGKEVDARTDIFAFGAVVYEMATGKRAFEGKSQASVIGAILKDDPPPMSSLQPMTPPALDRVVKKCLAKEPEKRWQAASDVCDELKWIAEGGSQTGVPTPVASRWSVWQSLAWGAATVFLLSTLALGTMLLLGTPPVESKRVSKWVETLPESVGSDAALAISRDGTRLAYSSGGRIWVRDLAGTESKPIQGTEGGTRPFFSPDGQWIAFGADTGSVLKKIAVTGGAAVTVCEGQLIFGGSWGDNNRIIFPGPNRGLTLASSAGDDCKPVTSPGDHGEYEYHFPQFLPGAKSVLFSNGVMGTFDSAKIEILNLEDLSRHVLVNGGAAARYVQSGHLIYVREGTLYAAPFDLRNLAVTGPAVPVAEGIFYNAAGGFANYSVSDSGLLVYMEENRMAITGTLEWRTRAGGSQPVSAPQQDYEEIRLSPDGLRAVVDVRRDGNNIDILTVDLGRGALMTLASSLVSPYPDWTPDGRSVVFWANRGGTIDRTTADGSGQPVALTRSLGTQPFGSPDGQTLLYTQGSQMWMVQIPDGKPSLLFETATGGLRDGQISPDGKWVAYTSDESGKRQVYVRQFPGGGEKLAISIDGGQEAKWSGNGRELFYRDPAKNQLMAVDIQTNPAFRAGQPKALFTLPSPYWDAAPDGKRFLVVKKPEVAAPRAARMHIVVNWFEELKQKVPVGKK